MPRTRPHILGPALAILILAILAALGPLGCAKTVLPTTPGPGVAAPMAETVRAEAEQAWQDKNYARSEMLYQRLLDMKGLDRDVEIEAWGRLAGSALAAGHGRIALDALDRQARLDPAVQGQWPWHEMAVEALEALGEKAAAQARLRSLADDQAAPAPLRSAAGLRLARSQWALGDAAGAMRSLALLYAQFPEPSGPAWDSPRARLEAALFKELGRVDQTVMDGLAGLADETNGDGFPYAVILLEKARRLLKAEAVPADARRLLQRLSARARFANPSLLQEVMAPLAARLGGAGAGVVLALPLTGQYADVGWKILRGAGAAYWNLTLAGNAPNLKVVNTEALGWLDQLAALGPEYTLAGGPLRAENLERMHERGITRQRPVFAFLPRPGNLDEGQDVWRFFTGPHDQVRSLLAFAVAGMGIQRIAVLHPEEPFGVRLTQSFQDEALRQGAVVGPVLGYPPKDPQKWAAKVTELLDVPPKSGPDDEPLPPDPPFKAVFLPDGWSQAQLLVPQFFFYEEDRLLLLGPSLWGQGLANDEHVEGRYFRLAVYPAAFAADSPAPGTRDLVAAMDRDGLGGPDLWTALGFDFMRFAGHMGPLPATWTPADVTAAARGAQAMDWSMAPMAWDDSGQAAQDLFLFQPTDNGSVPLDMDRLRARLEWIKKKHEERLAGLVDKKEMQHLLKRRQAIQEQLGPPEAGRALTLEEMRINTRLRTLQEQLDARARQREQGGQGR